VVFVGLWLVYQGHGVEKRAFIPSTEVKHNNIIAFPIYFVESHPRTNKPFVTPMPCSNHKYQPSPSIASVSHSAPYSFPLLSTPSQSQTRLNIVPDYLLIILPPLPPHLRRLHIRRALIIRLSEHAHHADQYLLHALYRRPALGGLLVVVWVVAGRVQD
jgi:hypothetical protein